MTEKEKLLNVVHLCSQDYGGAGKAAYRLHKGLQAIGIHSIMFVINKRSNDPSVKILPPNHSGSLVSCSEIANLNPSAWTKSTNRWEALLSNYPKRPRGLEIFTDAISDIRLDLVQEIQETDIINLHWVAGLVDYPSVQIALGEKPIVWTVHDMNPFTGGCHYSGDCIKYKTSCGACPQLGSDNFNDLSQYIWKQKFNAYKNLKINVVTPSKWLAQCARESTLFSRFSVNIIPYGFPVDIFKPYLKAEVRKALNISSDANVILFGADSVLNERKGFKYLLEAVNNLSPRDQNNNIILAFFGDLPKGAKLDLKYPLFKLGTIADENQLAMIYSAADVFVMPSLEDNLPNTVVEAIACGIPVVGFDIGGIPDIIEHKKTGFLVKPKNVAGLIEGIDWIISSDGNKYKLSRLCREKAVKEYTVEVQANGYKKLYYNSLWSDHAE